MAELQYFSFWTIRSRTCSRGNYSQLGFCENLLLFFLLSVHREYWLSLLVYNQAFQGILNFRNPLSIAWGKIFTLTNRLRDCHQVNRQLISRKFTALLLSPTRTKKKHQVVVSFWQLLFHHCWSCTCTQRSWTLVTVLTYASNLFSIKFSFHLKWVFFASTPFGRSVKFWFLSSQLPPRVFWRFSHLPVKSAFPNSH